MLAGAILRIKDFQLIRRICPSLRMLFRTAIAEAVLLSVKGKTART